jgi:hypothetical protein
MLVVSTLLYYGLLIDCFYLLKTSKRYFKEIFSELVYESDLHGLYVYQNIRMYLLYC